MLEREKWKVVWETGEQANQMPDPTKLKAMQLTRCYANATL